MWQRPSILVFLLCSVSHPVDSRSACAAEDPPNRPVRLELISSQQLWGEAPHSAFTTLIRFDGQWYCAFRESETHAVGPAAVRVITSANGDAWESAAVLREEGFDLRDPHLSITPRGELMLIACRGIQPTDTASRRFQTVVRFSRDGHAWTPPLEVGEPRFWMWSAAWQQEDCYAFGYDYANRNQLRLYRSQDGGRSFQTYVDDLGDGSYPNETSVVFDEDRTAYCLLRRGGPARLGKSRPPYREWEWQETGISVGGPALIRLPDGRWLAGGRGSKDGARTMLWQIDLETGSMAEVAVLPSGGDTSYPGLVWHDGMLWVSYYASHEGKTQIYLAKLKPAEAAKSQFE